MVPHRCEPQDLDDVADEREQRHDSDGHPPRSDALPSGERCPARTDDADHGGTHAAGDPATHNAAYPISVFPAQGPCSFADTYGASRSGGRFHEGVDIIAKAGQWVYAVKDGTLTRQYFDATASLSGNGWRLTAPDGTYFFYAHLSTFAPGLTVGSPVRAGQIIGQIGMTGNAPIPHLHFEVHPGGGGSINPTATVKAVDGCKTSAVPPQPNGSVPPTTVPPTTVPPPTGPAPTLPPIAAPAPTTTTTVYVPVAHRRDATYLDGNPRPRR